MQFKNTIFKNQNLCYLDSHFILFSNCILPRIFNGSTFLAFHDSSAAST